MKALIAAALLLAAPAFAKKSAPKDLPAGCKKMCSANSQPCGNSCISKKLTCHKAAGTACAAK